MNFKTKIRKDRFAKRLKKIMEIHGETNKSIGNIIHLDKSTISRYLNKKMSPKVTTVKILAQHFNVNPVWLMGFDVEKSLDKVSESHANYSAYSKDEQDLIENYRKLNEKQKAKLEGIIEGILIESNESAAKKGA